MDIVINASYHRLRLTEMELTADYINKLAAEKEREREERGRLREERQAQVEFQRQREKLERERAHYANALAALEAKGDLEAVQRLRDELGEIDRAIKDVTTGPRISGPGMSMSSPTPVPSVTKW